MASNVNGREARGARVDTDVDDLEDDDVEDEQEVDDNDSDDQDDAPPKQSADALQRSLRRERAKVRKLVEEVSTLKGTSKRQTKRSATRDAAQDEEQLRQSITEDIRSQADSEWGARLVVAEAVTELLSKNVRGNPRRVVRLLNLEDVSVTNGKVDIDALQDAIEDLAEESPEYFKRRRSTRDDEDEDDEPPARNQRRSRRSTGGSNDFGTKTISNGSKKVTDPIERAIRLASGGR